MIALPDVVSPSFQGAAPLEDERAVVEGVTHADRLVDADRARVLGAHEQADGRHAIEEEPAEVAEAAPAVAAVARRRLDPDLLQLYRRRRPCRGLRLEPDHTVVDPDPRAALFDLSASAPPEAVGIAAERVDPDLLAVRRRAGGDEQVEILEPSLPQTRPARLGVLVQDVDRLSRPIVPRPGQLRRRLCPPLAHRPFLADDHARQPPA